MLGIYFNVSGPNSFYGARDVSFTGRVPKLPPLKMPKPPKPPKSDGPFGVLDEISLSMIRQIKESAYKEGIPTNTWLKNKLKFLPYTPAVSAVESKNAKIGNLKVHTLIDGDQIFDKTYEYLKSAQKSIQVEMLEFQNLTVDGSRWALNGADKLKNASEKQQKILFMLINKKREHPEMKVQLILDAHKWYIDSSGRKKHYGNQDMIRFLKQNGIDVVPYPRASQKGAALQHIKLLVVDGKKAIFGGMNWGTHSPANHDACIAIENLKENKPSEVDNLMEKVFNADWKFSWQRLGATELVPGPLTEAEQKFYRGLNKEIKQENVDYHKLLSEFFDTPEAKNRYAEGRLDLIEAKPLENSNLKVLVTRPRELELVGEKGSEEIFEHVIDRLKTAKKLRGELFYATNKEMRKIIIQRAKAGELDAKLIIHETDFPYCENAYDDFIENGVSVTIYKGEKAINQRMHSKWMIFDDKEILIGSSNMSGMALNQNLKTGRRKDYPLDTEEIEKNIQEFVEKVKVHENKLKLPVLKWDGSDAAYQALIESQKTLRLAYNRLKSKGNATFNLGKENFTLLQEERKIIKNGKEYKLNDSEPKDLLALLRNVRGYYKIIQKRHLAKEHYKRGNNEMAVAFESPKLAGVFLKQFDLDAVHSQSKYEATKMKQIPDIPPKPLNNQGWIA